MKVIKGHLTITEKRAIKAILNAGLMKGKVNGKEYYLSLSEGVYTVEIHQKDRGLIPCPGSKLRMSRYINQFKL